jgi:hypothetical protein
MATLAQQPRFQTGSDDRFFLWSAFAMAAVIAAGFSLNIVMARSTFAAPALVHAHAVVFMGWVGIYVLQTVFAVTGNRALHKRLGWIAAGWMVLMLVMGLAITVTMARNGRVPFFFQPQQFLIFNPLTLLGFLACSGTAIAMRRRTDWHRRLHLTGMAMILGPGFGRLLPMPLLIPAAFEAAFAAGMLFPLAGAVADWRRSGHVHPAWVWGIAAMMAVWVTADMVTFSRLGDRIYAAVTIGTPGATVPGLAFPPPPGPPPA